MYAEMGCSNPCRWDQQTKSGHEGLKSKSKGVVVQMLACMDREGGLLGAG